jgi:hypothetical protein
MPRRPKKIDWETYARHQRKVAILQARAFCVQIRAKLIDPYDRFAGSMAEDVWSLALCVQSARLRAHCYSDIQRKARADRLALEQFKRESRENRRALKRLRRQFLTEPGQT